MSQSEGLASCLVFIRTLCVFFLLLFFYSFSDAFFIFAIEIRKTARLHIIVDGVNAILFFLVPHLLSDF